MNKKEKAVLNNFIDTYTQWIEHLKKDKNISNQERTIKKVMIDLFIKDLKKIKEV